MPHTKMAEPDLLKLGAAGVMELPIIDPSSLDRSVEVVRLTERVVLGL
jgi:hypothetical protein